MHRKLADWDSSAETGSENVSDATRTGGAGREATHPGAMPTGSEPPVRRVPPEVETRFQSLVQSPLRGAILRFMHARPNETFDLESLTQTFGRMRLDVENCLRELVDFGVARRLPGPPVRFLALRPEN